MFFLVNLVFGSTSTSSITNARIIGRSKEPDVTVNIVNSEYVLTNAVLDPTTKGNIETYIVKDNVDTVFSLFHGAEERRYATLRNYYYRPYKNKNLTIRCFDTTYFGGTAINIVPQKIYDVLKVTNRLEDCLFIFELEYDVKNDDEVVEKRKKKYAFKIVNEKDYEMYKNMEKPVIEEDDGVIKRPKKREQ